MDPNGNATNTAEAAKMRRIGRGAESGVSTSRVYGSGAPAHFPEGALHTAGGEIFAFFLPEAKFFAFITAEGE